MRSVAAGSDDSGLAERVGLSKPGVSVDAGGWRMESVCHWREAVAQEGRGRLDLSGARGRLTDRRGPTRLTDGEECSSIYERGRCTMR